MSNCAYIDALFDKTIFIKKVAPYPTPSPKVTQYKSTLLLLDSQSCVKLKAITIWGKIVCHKKMYLR